MPIRPLVRPVGGSLRPSVPGCGLGALLLALMSGGCTLGDRLGAEGLLVEIPAPVTIPAGSAHARFQGGRQVAAASRIEPYCELEIKTVSERPQQAQPGRYPIRGQRFTLLRDPTTRIPALLTGINCSDPLFQESFWRVGAVSGGNLYALRCIRPFYNCAFGPPLSLGEVGAVTGAAIRIKGPGPDPGG